MQKEMISASQAKCIIATFILGSSMILGGSTEAAQDSWISLLMAAVYFIPVALIYARIMRLYPEKDIFCILEILFGKIAGKALIVLFTWYALHLTSLVLSNFTQFIVTTAMPETPPLALSIIMILVTAYIAVSGIETLGKWALVTLPIIILIVVFTIIASIQQMDFSHIQPVMAHSFSDISSTSFTIFTFPFAESVLFLGVAGSIKIKSSPYKTYIYGVMLGALFLLLAMLRNIELLGPALIQQKYFPSFSAARVIYIGDYFARIEGTVSMNYILSGISKTALSLLVASKGIAHLFGIKQYRLIVVPVALLAVALRAILFTNAMQMSDFVKVYQYYAVPFQIIIPLLVWIAAEIKTRRNKKIKVSAAS